MHVIKVVIKVIGLIFIGNVVAHRMLAVAVGGVIRVVPIEQRIIKTDLDALCAERVEILTHDVFAVRRVRDLPIGESGIKQAEAVVVLCREHGVLHAGLLCKARPLFRVKIFRIKLVEKRDVVLLRNLFRGAHPLAARRNGVKAPMDKHAEAVVGKPLHTLIIFFSIKFIHTNSVLSPAISGILTVIVSFCPAFVNRYSREKRKEKRLANSTVDTRERDALSLLQL